MTHAQAEQLNLSGRCRNHTAGVAPWLSWKQNSNVARVLHFSSFHGSLQQLPRVSVNTARPTPVPGKKTLGTFGEDYSPAYTVLGAVPLHELVPEHAVWGWHYSFTTVISVLSGEYECLLAASTPKFKIWTFWIKSR